MHVLLLVATLIVVPSVSFAGIVSADLSITKTDGAASSTPGTGIVYTITASNGGAADVMGATVADTFPAILTCTWTCTASAGSSCTAAGAGSINDAANLLNGGSATYVASCTIDPSATGSLANTATVSSAVTDPNMANNSATDTNTLTPSADLSLLVLVTPNPATVGSIITIDVTVTNSGPSDATGVVVTTTLPPIVAFSSTTGCAEDPNGNPTCTLGTIPAGQMASFTMTAQVTGTGSDPIDVSVGSAVSDPNGGNDTASVTLGAQSVLEVPTTSEVGLILLALLLVAAAFWAIRR